jgi:putative tricarboxylic transport membrane protein
MEPPAGVAEVQAHRGPGGVWVAGDDGLRDAVMLAPDPLDMARIGQRIRVGPSESSRSR